MRAFAPALFLMAGCGSPEADCKSGFEAGGDGLCYQFAPDAPDTTETQDPGEIADFVAALPPCTATSGDGALALEVACVSGACAGDTFAQIEEALGAPLECFRISLEYGPFTVEYTSCDWTSGLKAEFDEPVEEGWPTPSSRSRSVDLALPSEAASDEGIGMGAEFSCFVEAFGEPDHLILRRRPQGAWEATHMAYPRFSVSDYRDNETGLNGSDGLVDAISLR